MDWLDFYKEFYFQELERKYSLMRSMSIPVGVATLLFSGLLFISGRLTHVASFFDLALLMLLVCTALLLFLSIYFMKCAWFNHAYQYIPTTLQIASHKKALENYYRQLHDEEQALQQADEETVSFLIDTLASTAHHNTLVNDTRTRFLFWANASLSGALFLLILAGVATVPQSILVSV